MSSTTQLKKLEAFHEMLFDCEAFKSTSPDDMISFPTGDGMCIGFFNDAELPILLAIQLHEKLLDYNKGKIPTELILTRIGIHSGSCFYFTDIHGKKNVWGPGVITARRIMDLGDANHILLSARIAEDLQELSDEYRTILKPLQNYVFKHDVNMLVYAANGKSFGNPNPPAAQSNVQDKTQEEIKKLQNSALYPKVEVSLDVLDKESMLVHHKRTYQIRNVSDFDIKYVLHGIGTDVKKPMLSDLNAKIYDDKRKPMRISSITLNDPFCKEFSTEFSKPVSKNDDSSYTLEYEVEEPQRFFENNFAVSCDIFVLNFSYSDSSMKPILYEVNLESDTKTKHEAEPKISKTDFGFTAKWILKNMVKGQTIRLEW